MENEGPPAQWVWWENAIAGVLTILFGVAALAWPGLTLFVLVWLFGFFSLLYGIVALVGMFRAMGAGTTWWTYLLVGLINVGVGLFVLLSPGISTVALVFAIAIWAVALGIVEVVSGIAQPQFLLVVTGVISVLFGLVLLANPLAGALALVWVIGAFAIVRGVVLLAGAFRAPRAPAPPGEAG